MLTCVRVPVSGVEAIEAVKVFVSEREELLRITKVMLTNVCQGIGRLLQPDNVHGAWMSYAICVTASLTLAIIEGLLGAQAIWIVLMVGRIVWLLFVTALFTQKATLCLRLFTVCRANYDFLVAKSRRSRTISADACSSWAFFKAEQETINARGDVNVEPSKT